MASSAAIFSLAIGAVATPIRVSPNTTVQSLTSYSDFGKDVLQFVNVEQIKSYLKSKMSKDKEIDSGRYAGMLIPKGSKNQRMLIYVAPKGNFEWTRYYYKNEIFAYTKHLYHVL